MIGNVTSLLEAMRGSTCHYILQFNVGCDWARNGRESLFFK